MKRFTTNVQTLELSGGCHICCSPDMVNNEATDDEVKYEIEKFKAIFFLKHADTTRYDELRVEFRNGAYAGREEYPVTLSSTYDVLVRRSGQFTVDKISATRKGRGNDRGDDGMRVGFLQCRTTNGYDLTPDKDDTTINVLR